MVGVAVSGRTRDQLVGHARDAIAEFGDGELDRSAFAWLASALGPPNLAEPIELAVAALDDDVGLVGPPDGIVRPGGTRGERR